MLFLLTILQTLTHLHTQWLLLLVLYCLFNCSTDWLITSTTLFPRSQSQLLLYTIFHFRFPNKWNRLKTWASSPNVVPTRTSRLSQSCMRSLKLSQTQKAQPAWPMVGLLFIYVRNKCTKLSTNVLISIRITTFAIIMVNNSIGCTNTHSSVMHDKLNINSYKLATS